MVSIEYLLIVKDNLLQFMTTTSELVFHCPKIFVVHFVVIAIGRAGAHVLDWKVHN